MPSYTAYLSQGSDSLAKHILVVDDRVNMQLPINAKPIGGVTYPHRKGYTIVHQVQFLLEAFDIYDITNVTITVKYHEPAVLYELPEMVHANLKEPTRIRWSALPTDASSHPEFQSRDESIAVVDPYGHVIGKQQGTTTIVVTDSDNPILKYELPVIVHHS